MAGPTPKGVNPTGHKNGASDAKEKPSADWMTVFTGILAFFACASFIVLWIQLGDARKSFVAGDRPYVWIANDTINNSGLTATVYPNPTGRKQIVATMRYSNFGRSPAIIVRSYHNIILGQSFGKITPLPWNNQRTIVPTGRIDMFSAVSPPITDTDVSNYLKAPEGDGITVYATWQYLDTFGNRYETEICFTRLNSGSWAYCHEHNDIKDCSRLPCEP